MPGKNLKGNARTVTRSQLSTLRDFPALTPGGTGKIVTKHLLSLSLTIGTNQLALLIFIIYQSETDNTIKYCTDLVNRYCIAVRLAQARYGKAEKIHYSAPYVRRNFKYAIENGFLLPTKNYNVFLVNPSLCYSKLYVKGRFYDQWLSGYRLNKNFQEQSEQFIAHVRGNL